ncbi:MAG TPA: phosphopantetheine-binding protein [Verrucomicrobiae bacterium]|nr:phosphopantetheine-binding protein [Verrucomicrobiae bacterium]
MAEVSLDDLRKLVVENCVLKIKPEEIGEDTPLFGPDGVGLDSLDALQLTIAIEQQFGIVITDANVAREAMGSLGSLRRWLAQQPSRSANS